MSATLHRSPLQLYICHDESDQRYLRQLRKHLAPLVESRLVSVSDATMTAPGESIQDRQQVNMAAADLLILLVSAAFISEKVTEIRFALSQIERGAKIVPILLRPVALAHTLLAPFAVLPKNQRPICLWRNIDSAWTDVVAALPDIPAYAPKTSLVAANPTRSPRLRLAEKCLAFILFLALVVSLGMPDEPPFAPDTGGIVVLGHFPSALWPDSTFRSICHTAAARDPHAVRCVMGRSVRQAFALKASLVVEVTHDQTAQLLSPPGQQMMVPLGPIAMPQGPDAVAQLVAVALQLSRWFVGGVAPQAFPNVDIPKRPAREVGEALAVLSSYIRWRQAGGTLSDQDPTKTDRPFLAAVAAQCAERPVTPWHCQLAQWLYATDCPRCPGVYENLVQLAEKEGPLRFVAQLELAEQLCRTSPVEAAQILGKIIPQQPCDEVSLLGVSSCVLSGRPAGLSSQATARLTRWADANPLARTGCPKAQVAAALGWRGIYSSLHGGWDKARVDFAAAYQIESRSVWLLMEAEAALQLGEHFAVREILRPENLRMITEPRHQVLAHFFRYLASPEETMSRRYMLAGYDVLPVQAIVLTDEGATLKSLTCRSPQGTICQVYDVLTSPKQQGSLKELQQLLFPASR